MGLTSKPKSSDRSRAALASLALFERYRELEWESKLTDDLEDMGDGATSISDTPAGVKGVRESVKCHAPSGRRIAMRMSSPGLCLNLGKFAPEFGPIEPNGVMFAAGWS